MSSGFFILDGAERSSKIKRFLKNTAKIYAISILIYLPVNIYSGYFSSAPLLPNILKDLIFDGTFYHLWYLPAAMLGACVSWLLIKRLGERRASFIALGLYALGLLGDSYYGLVQQLPALNCVYAHMFELFDYTRNGLFFAPIFFIAGASARHINISRIKSALLFILCLALMLLEGLILRQHHMQRHDSMYIMLLPSALFLFAFLKTIRGKRLKTARNASLLIYILHPLAIILLRGIARLFDARELLIDNSLIYFCSVVLISAAGAYILLLAEKLLTSLIKKRQLNSGPDIPARYLAESRQYINGPAEIKNNSLARRAWLEISLEQLRLNTQALLNALPPRCGLMAVVKADAYGLGAVPISQFLNQIGVDSFAVSTIDEGISLRRHGIKGEILILGYTDIARARELKRYKLTQTAIDYPYALALNNAGFRLKVHAAVDTGMKRLGIQPQNKEELLALFKLPRLNVTGVYSHLCDSFSREKESLEFTKKQIDSFNQMLDYLKRSGIKLPPAHLQSSYGLLNFPQLNYSRVRSAAVLFGLLDYPDTALKLEIQPVVSLKARVAMLKHIKAGESVGYGREFTAQRDTLIAIIPAGYADGIPASLSCGAGQALIRGRRAKIAGRTCMDQMMLDVTDIPDICRGDIVTFIGQSGAESISPSEMARNAGISVNELICRLAARLDRLYLE